MEAYKVYTIDLSAFDNKMKRVLQAGSYSLAAVGIETGMANLDKAGYQIQEILQKFGFWIVTVKCTYDLIQCALKGDKRSIGNVIITYVIIYGALFFVPWCLKLVENLFG